jgi:hypothetical protein
MSFDEKQAGSKTGPVETLENIDVSEISGQRLQSSNDAFSLLILLRSRLSEVVMLITRP